MALTRREILAGGTAVAALLAMPAAPARASVEDALMAVTGGAEAVEGGIELTAPEIAENGNTVPVEVSAPGAVAITILATGNPLPGVATFRFGPLAGAQAGATRIRLAKTQDVVAVAEMADGTFHKTSQTVKVTIGGCGG